MNTSPQIRCGSTGVKTLMFKSRLRHISTQQGQFPLCVETIRKLLFASLFKRLFKLSKQHLFTNNKYVGMCCSVVLVKKASVPTQKTKLGTLVDTHKNSSYVPAKSPQEACAGQEKSANQQGQSLPSWWLPRKTSGFKSTYTCWDAQQYAAKRCKRRWSRICQ